jgi:hypothetical protein
MDATVIRQIIWAAGTTPYGSAKLDDTKLTAMLEQTEASVDRYPAPEVNPGELAVVVA